MPGKEDQVYLLKMSLDGLKQTPRQWYKRFYDFIISKGSKRGKYDYYVYHKRVNKLNAIYLLLYVDHIPITSKDRVEINKLKISSGINLK